MAGNAVDQGRSVTSKLAAILTAFNAGSSHHLSELARRTGLPMSTTHRLLHELVDKAFLCRGPDGSFRPGPAVSRLSHALPQPPTLRERAPHVVEDLVEALHRPVRFGVLDGLEVAYIEKAPGYTPVTSFSPAARLPAHATALGKALLAFGPAETVRRVAAGGLTAYTARTLTRPDQLLHALQVTRNDGLATSRGELTEALAVAVPVLGPDAVALAAIEVDVAALTPETIAAVTPALRLAAHALNRELHPHLYEQPDAEDGQFGAEQPAPA
jgi:DNA-binding IclR family transcriptional regulator